MSAKHLASHSPTLLSVVVSSPTTLQRSVLHCPPYSQHYRRSVSSKPTTKRIDETSISGAQHKPSVGGASLAHLVSELSATTPHMIKSGTRVEGQTTDEESRAKIRRTAKWLMGFPVAVSSLWVLWQWSKGDMKLLHGTKPD